MMKKNLKERFIAEIPSEFISQENFQDLFNQTAQQEIKAGTVVKGRVVGIDRDVVIVDVKLKNEGRIPVSEFELASDMSLPKVGDLVDVYIEKIEGRNGHTVLSREKALREESWIALEQAQKDGMLVDGVIFGKVKGGFTVDLSGVVAFLPGSQVDVQPVKNMSALMNIVQQFQILKMDKKLGNIVVSRRAILEESRAEAREEMLSKIQVGMVLDGVVKNIVHYGAFIELAIGDSKLYLDGLLHVTDILWRRINHPSEVLSIGQQVKVMVIKFSRDSERISLGMKQLDNNPWEVIDTKFKVGDIRVGKVKSIAEYGVFIEITEEMEGLCHTSEISWNKANQNPKKSLTIGQEVIFKILDVDKEKYRISLSLKQCQPNPWEVLVKNFPVGTIVNSPIRNIADFGMFVALSVTTAPVKYQINGKEYQVDGASYLIDGMIHTSDISWYGAGEDLLKNYNKGDEVECKVIAIDLDKERISLGIKQLTRNVYDDIQEGQAVEVTITEIYKEGIQVSFDQDIVGFIKRADLSNDKFKQKPENFEVGSIVKAKIINVDKSNRNISVSIKALEVEEQDRLMKEYSTSNNDSSANLGDAIGDALLQVGDQVSKNHEAAKEAQKKERQNSGNDLEK